MKPSRGNPTAFLHTPVSYRGCPWLIWPLLLLDNGTVGSCPDRSPATGSPQQPHCCFFKCLTFIAIFYNAAPQTPPEMKHGNQTSRIVRSRVIHLEPLVKFRVCWGSAGLRLAVIVQIQRYILASYCRGLNANKSSGPRFLI